MGQITEIALYVTFSYGFLFKHQISKKKISIDPKNANTFFWLIQSCSIVHPALEFFSVPAVAPNYLCNLFAAFVAAFVIRIYVICHVCVRNMAHMKSLLCKHDKKKNCFGSCC